MCDMGCCRHIVVKATFICRSVLVYCLTQNNTTAIYKQIPIIRHLQAINWHIFLRLYTTKIRQFSAKMGQKRTKIPSKTAFNIKKHNITKCSQATHLRHLRALNLAGAVRIELTTRGFGDRCSTCWAIPLQNWWAIGDSNPEPTGYEPVALTNWANGPRIMIEIYSSQEEPDCCSFLVSAFIYLSGPSPAKYFRRIWA